MGVGSEIRDVARDFRIQHHPTPFNMYTTAEGRTKRNSLIFDLHFTFYFVLNSEVPSLQFRLQTHLKRVFLSNDADCRRGELLAWHWCRNQCICMSAIFLQLQQKSYHARRFFFEATTLNIVKSNTNHENKVQYHKWSPKLQAPGARMTVVKQSPSLIPIHATGFS